MVNPTPVKSSPGQVVAITLLLVLPAYVWIEQILGLFSKCMLIFLWFKRPQKAICPVVIPEAWGCSCVVHQRKVGR